MKVTLKFVLPDEAEDLRAAQNGPRYRAALLDVHGALRNKIKYDNKLSAQTRRELDAVYKLLLEGLADVGEEI